MKILDIINEELRIKNEEHSTRERSGCFNPSKFGSCFRAQIWNRANMQSLPVDERTLRVFKVGNMFEDYVCQYMEGCEFQVEVKEDDVFGYCDAMDKERVYEIKSQHSFGFHYMMKDGYDIKKQKAHNILQVMYYAKMLDKEYGDIIWVSKDDLCIYQHTFFTDEWAPVVDTELARLREYWDIYTNTGELPLPEPRLFYKTKTNSYDEHTKYCSYRELCR